MYLFFHIKRLAYLKKKCFSYRIAPLFLKNGLYLVRIKIMRLGIIRKFESKFCVLGEDIKETELLFDQKYFLSQLLKLC